MEYYSKCTGENTNVYFCSFYMYSGGAAEYLLWGLFLKKINKYNDKYSSKQKYK